jgi:hypothetical protein
MYGGVGVVVWVHGGGRNLLQNVSVSVCEDEHAEVHL